MIAEKRNLMRLLGILISNKYVVVHENAKRRGAIKGKPGSAQYQSQSLLPAVSDD
jgi:hypothetical protein